VKEGSAYHHPRKGKGAFSRPQETDFSERGKEKKKEKSIILCIEAKKERMIILST